MSAAADFLADAPPAGVVILPDGERRPAAPAKARSDTPLVSCVMVSRGTAEILRHSVACFRRQTYANRELVVILQEVSPELRTYLDSLEDRRIAVHVMPASLTLGDLRNMAIARAKGRLICQWDDDDLHHARYLEQMVGFVEANEAGAAFLDQWTIWWPRRRLFALSHRRLWEGSMLARRYRIPIYPSLQKREDAVATQILTRNNPVVAVRAPHLYVYTVTGQNTWDDAHMERLITGEGSRRCQPEAYDRIFDRLDGLYDVASYQAYCLRGDLRPR
jgi:glycosyltransferase involved in cell wall biosynthesis